MNRSLLTSVVLFATAAGCGGGPGSAVGGGGDSGGGAGGAGAAAGRTGNGGAGTGASSSMGGRASSTGGNAGGGSTRTGGGGAGGRPGGGGRGGASVPTGGTGAVACVPPEPSVLVGWAAASGSTTGGGAATPTTVTTLAQLNGAAAGTNAAVIWVEGSIAGSIKIGSNKTIIGLCGAALHGHVDISGSTNVVIRNITIVGYGSGNCALDPSYDAAVGCSSGADAVSVQNNSNHIWFDHCDISDGTDGNLDITTGSNYITVSWTKFHYSPRTDPVGNDSTGGSGHRFSNLVGGDDNATGDVNALNVTWHHNWWADNVVERQPRVRFGKNHLFNNVWSSVVSSYCVRAGMGAEILIENSLFTGVKNPQQFNNAADQATAFVTANNDVYTATTGSRVTGGGGTAFTTPPYTYTLDGTADLQATVQAGVGPR